MKLIGNKLLGGRQAIRLQAMATEEPGIWGWSHAPFLGGLIEGNVVEDSLGSSFRVDHDKAIKTNKGRTYMSFKFKDNTFRWTSARPRSATEPKVELSSGPSLDPGEMIVTEEGTKVEGALPKTVWVHAATINGKVVKDAPLKPDGPIGARGTNNPKSGPSRRQ